jgi:type IV pilus assembly protein PilB
MSARVRIGEVLVDAGLLTRAQLDRALAEQRAEGIGGQRLGQLVVTLGFVTEDQLAKALSQQLAVPWVSLGHVDFSPSLLDLVDRETAEQYCVIPVYVRRERKDVDTLFLAMDDPTQDEVLRLIADRTRFNVRPMIAPPTDIREAIARAYGPSGESSLGAAAPRPRRPSLGERTSGASLGISPELPVMTPDQPQPRPSIADRPPSPPTPSEEARPPATPRLPESDEVTPDDPVQPEAPRLVPVTLLDGTTLQLPVDRPRPRPRTHSGSLEHAAGEAGSPASLTADALRASLRGLTPEQRADRLEAIVLSLVAALTRRGLLSERDVLDAL